MRRMPNYGPVPLIFAAILSLTAIGHAADPKPADRSRLEIKLPPANGEDLPPRETHYQGREIATTMHYLGADWLTRDSREREEECSTLLKVLKIQPGQTVCDLGCGNGFYSLQIAKLVGERGSVLAIDVQRQMLELLVDRAAEEDIRNVRPILGTDIDPQLPAGSVDLVLMADVYHEFAYPKQMLQSIRKCLRPHGRIVLVEFRAEDPNVPIKPLHKMSKEQILKEIPPLGFRLVEQFDGLPRQHVMFFEADAEAAASK